MAVTSEEYATLTDLLAAQQREINDIEVVLSGHRQTIDVHTTDIADLQDPPAGVPPELLAWLSTNTITDVDTTLDTTITTLSASVDAHTDEIANLSSNLTQEVTDRQDADTALSAVDTDLQAQVTANLDTLTQEISDRSALSVTVSSGLDTVNTRIDDLQSDLSSATESAAGDSVSMSSQIASLNASVQTAQTQILLLQGTGVDPLGALASQITTLTTISNDAAADVAQETLDREAADTTIVSTVTTLSSSITGLNTGISNETAARTAADLDIASDVAALTAEVGGHAGLISSEESARIAADAALQVDVDANTTDIANAQVDIGDEVTDRTNADAALQSTVDANTADIATNTSSIADNTTDLAVVQAKFGVVKDVGNYITDWRILDSSTPAGMFKVRNLNNDARLQNPGYEGKYFAPVSAVSFAAPVSYDTEYGGATSNDFRGGDGNDYTRDVKVYSTLTLAITGSCFAGVDYSTGGNFNRLGQVLTTFLVNISGSVNRYLSLWYRIKATPGTTSGRWYPAALADNTLPSQRTYERINSSRVLQISVDADKVIEFGLTVLNTEDATIDDASAGFIYSGSATVTAFNMTTIS